jgi:hypothetical protein
VLCPCMCIFMYTYICARGHCGSRMARAPPSSLLPRCRCKWGFRRSGGTPVLGRGHCDPDSSPDVGSADRRGGPPRWDARRRRRRRRLTWCTRHNGYAEETATQHSLLAMGSWQCLSSCQPGGTPPTNTSQWGARSTLACLLLCSRMPVVHSAAHDCRDFVSVMHPVVLALRSIRTLRIPLTSASSAALEMPGLMPLTCVVPGRRRVGLFLPYSKPWRVVHCHDGANDRLH